MKGVATIVLLLLLSVQTFSKWMWVLDYNLNRNYIAATLCVNKAKPMLHCNGQCQLAKKLAADDTNSNTSGNTVQKVELSTAFFKPETALNLAPLTAAVALPKAVYTLQPCTSEITAVFHPPGV